MSDEWMIDSGKLSLHPAWAAQWLDSQDDWEKAKKLYPLYWEITSSAACNHRCTFCSTDAIGYPAILMDSEILKHRMIEAHRLGVKSVMFGGTGEPLVHKGISAIADTAWANGLDVAFTTNGVLLNKLDCVEHCIWIKVSINAGTKESYAKIHRTEEKDWDKVWENIREAVKRKGNCTIGVQCVVLPENAYDMGNLAKLCIEAAVDYLVLKPYSQATFMLSHTYENIDYTTMREYLQSVVKMSAKTFKVIYRGNAINEEISKKHSYDKCRATPTAWVYSMADGRVFTCSAHLLDERFCIGNLNEQTFQEIWEGDKRKENWRLMREEFNISACRLNCRMNSSNKYLHQLTHQSHVNFI